MPGGSRRWRLSYSLRPSPPSLRPSPPFPPLPAGRGGWETGYKGLACKYLSQPSLLDHLSSTIYPHPSPSSIPFHPSPLIHLPSSISPHPSLLNHLASSISPHPSPLIHPPHPSPFIHLPSSISHHPSPFIHLPLSRLHWTDCNIGENAGQFPSESGQFEGGLQSTVPSIASEE